MIRTIVILGAGQAGLQTAASLRSGGYDGRLTLVGEEPHAPYQRPPLSKAFLAGKAQADRLALKAPDFYAQAGIDLVTGVAAHAIDPAARRVSLRDGSVLAYDRLVLATGARPRRLPVPGGDAAGVLVLRDLADAAELRERLGMSQRIVVIGGGFIGLECAASLTRLGHAVSVVEAQDRLMARAVSPILSAAFAALHRAEGVDLRLGASVARVTVTDGRATGVDLADGTHLPADLVLVGIGVAPNDTIANSAGLATRDGIVVDASLTTADPAILAIGDAARFPSRLTGGLTRIESVQNAIDHGKAAAETLLGRPAPYDATPWFWSDQYEAKLQIAGLDTGADRFVTRGDPESGRFSVFAYRAGRLVAVDSLNRPADHMIARRLLAAGLSPEPTMAADPDADLKALLPAA